MSIFSVSIATATAGLTIVSLALPSTANATDQREGDKVMTGAMTTQQRNKAAVQERFAAWADGTGSPFDLLAENATWTITGRSAASRT